MLPTLLKKEKIPPAAHIDKLFYKKLFQNLFSHTCSVEFWDGEKVTFGDGNHKFKILLKEPLPLSNMVSNPSITFGEAYMFQQLDIQGNLQEVIQSLYENEKSFLRDKGKFNHLLAPIKNSMKKSKENIRCHYDIGNDFYKLWLDETMTYSCGYFKSKTDTLMDAQLNKVKHILKKLNLKEGLTLLDIGCGWGELIIAAAKKYKVKSLGITLSSEQFEATKNRIKKEGLEDLVDVQMKDYRQLKNMNFDRIVSVGMIEHVGKDFLGEYFSTVNGLLKSGGLSLLHCITSLYGGTDPWIDKYIFPGGYIPSMTDLMSNLTKESFHLIDLESLRMHYEKTLVHWADNFEHSMPIIKQMKDDSFIRMWRLYLNSCAASFHCGNIDVHQFLFSKGVNNNLPWTRNYLYMD